MHTFRMVVTETDQALRARALQEQEYRRRDETTYTRPLQRAPDMREFLQDFYRHVYTPKSRQYYDKVRRQYPEVDASYQALVGSGSSSSPPTLRVVGKVSLEDFWQRYEYRCGNLDRIIQELSSQEEREVAGGNGNGSDARVQQIIASARQQAGSATSSPRNLQEILADARKVREEAESSLAASKAKDEASRRWQEETSRLEKELISSVVAFEEVTSNASSATTASANNKSDKWKRRLADKRTRRHEEEDTAELDSSKHDSAEDNTSKAAGKKSERVQKWKERIASKRAVRTTILNHGEDRSTLADGSIADDGRDEAPLEMNEVTSDEATQSQLEFCEQRKKDKDGDVPPGDDTEATEESVANDSNDEGSNIHNMDDDVMVMKALSSETISKNDADEQQDLDNSSCESQSSVIVDALVDHFNRESSPERPIEPAVTMTADPEVVISRSVLDAYVDDEKGSSVDGDNCECLTPCTVM